MRPAGPPPRHIVLTGASSGLGEALATGYAAAGVRLTLSGRNPDRLAAVAQACRARGSTVVTEVCDVTDAEAMAGWLLRADEAAPVDLLYANAGIGGIGTVAPPEGESGALAQAVFATNTGGVVNTITPLLPRFVNRKSGHVVVIGSLAGRVALAHSPAYCASKSAVRVYAQGLRRLMRPHGVGVTIINPGFVDTPMSQTLPFVRPLLWSAEKAATAIRRKVAAGAREYTFPLPLALAAAVAAILPEAIVDSVLSNAYQRDRGHS